MAPKQQVVSDKAMKSPLLSQAIIHNGTVYVSGNVGMDPATNKFVEGSVSDRTVREVIAFATHSSLILAERQALENIRVVLEEAGSSLQNLIKVQDGHRRRGKYSDR